MADDMQNLSTNVASAGKVKPARFDAVIAGIAIFVAVMAAIARAFLFHPFSVSSESMLPNLKPNDYVWVSKWNYGFSHVSTPFMPKSQRGRVGGKPPQRGDLVAFKLPRDPRVDYIKRLVGLPGDRIQMVAGRLVINDTPIVYKERGEETFQSADNDAQKARRLRETLPGGKSYDIYDLATNSIFDDTAVFVVPPKHYFVMGDNRDNSSDSRADPLTQGGVGFVPEENLIGKVMVSEKVTN
jgi:signal peptidase I